MAGTLALGAVPRLQQRRERGRRGGGDEVEARYNGRLMKEEAGVAEGIISREGVMVSLKKPPLQDTKDGLAPVSQPHEGPLTPNCCDQRKLR